MLTIELFNLLKKRAKIGEYAYEEYVIDEVMADGIENSVTRIQIQI